MVDIDKVRRMMMTAFGAIRDGSSLSQYVADREDFGREIQISRALIYGEGLGDEFTDHEFEIVTAAFARFGEKPPSRDVRECCAAISLIAPLE